MLSKFRNCPRCKKTTFNVLSGRCDKCGYEALFVIPMEMQKPLDMSSFSLPISWGQKAGHAEFEYGYDFEYKDWFKDEKLKYFTGE